MANSGDRDLATRNPLRRLTLDGKAYTRRISLTLPEEISLDDWKDIGEQISVISDSSSWWLGDWLIYGQDRYPDRYHRAIADTALDYQTLRNYAWIARKFPPARRRESLSLQHHAEVAALPEHEQEVWLTRAQEFAWSRNVLRRNLQTARQKTLPEPLKAMPVQVTASDEQWRRWADAARAERRELTEWIISVVDRAAGTE